MWDVWEVRPTTSIAVSDNLSLGWLAFQSSVGDRRRLAPYPADWSNQSDPALRELLSSAWPVEGWRRLVE